MTLLSQESIDTAHLSGVQRVVNSLVHKHSLENVLLTEISTCGDNRFIGAGRIPTEHVFFNSPGKTPWKDILFYTELGRQASLAISHSFLDVSTEDVFIFERSEAAVTDPVWKSPLHTPLDSILVDVRIQEITRRRNNAVSHVVADHFLSIGGQQVFRGTGAWSIQPAALFQRLRRTSTARTLAAPFDARTCADVRVARPRLEAPANAVISRPEYVPNTPAFVSSLIVDPRHPYFFDHPCDHVPGMLLLEGSAQLALAAFAGTTSVPPGTSAVCAYDVNFAQFVECELPTTLTAYVAPQKSSDLRPPVVNVSISQQDVVCGTTTMKIAFLV
jgi:hypothetical protein